MGSVASSSSNKRAKAKVEFGDFQTPPRLARDVCALLLRRGVQPSSILEPNCGKGSFVLACLESFPSAQTVIGADINSTYDRLGDRKSTRLNSSHVRISYAVFCLKKKKKKISSS